VYRVSTTGGKLETMLDAYLPSNVLLRAVSPAKGDAKGLVYFL